MTMASWQSDPLHRHELRWAALAAALVLVAALRG